MKLHEAVEQSAVNSAYRPWELNPFVVTEDFERKYIVINSVNEDCYVVWAIDFRFARELFPQEYYKIKDKLDWEPVGSKQGN